MHICTSAHLCICASMHQCLPCGLPRSGVLIARTPSPPRTLPASNIRVHTCVQNVKSECTVVRLRTPKYWHFTSFTWVGPFKFLIENRDCEKPPQESQLSASYLSFILICIHSIRNSNQNVNCLPYLSLPYTRNVCMYTCDASLILPLKSLT